MPESPPAPRAPKALPPDVSEKADRDTRVIGAERRLAEQLSRAVAQGVVRTRVPGFPKSEATTPAAPIPLKKRDRPATKAGITKTPGLNLRAETSIDRDFLDSLGALPLTTSGASCLLSSQLDVAGWGGNGAFSQQISAHRRILMGEFDRPNAGAARDLARLYIHFGFGAEALHVLEISRLPENDRIILRAMGEIMEFGHAPSPAAFADQFACDTSAALWATLAHKNIPQASDINDKALLRAINELPPHLRSFLGTMLSSRLRAANHDDLAGQVLRLVERGAQQPDARLEMAQAEQKLVEGDIPSASEGFSNVVDANTDLSPNALIKLIESRLDANLPIEMQTADLAEAYAHEYRKQPLGEDLARVHILALAEAGAFDKAFHELSQFAEIASPETFAPTRSRAISTLAQNGSDPVFLKHVLGSEKTTPPPLESASANAVAGRLIELGFPARADHYLAQGNPGATTTERRLLRARAALAQMKPHRAEAHLLGLSGPEADSLRARASSMSGDHQAAQSLFAQLDLTAQMIEEAWLAEDWRTLRDSGDTLWSDVAEMATSLPGETGVDNAETGVLARNRALLEESSAARETITALLARYPLNDTTVQKK